MDDEPSWQRQLLLALSALLVVALLVGGILAVVAIRAADYVGVGTDRTSSSPAPILPTTGAATRTPKATKTPAHHKPSRHRAAPSIRLSASPRTVSALEHINLSGVYPGHASAQLQVERRLNDRPWGNFPVTITVSNGRFTSYILTSKVGQNYIRVTDKATGATSNVVTVKVG